MSIQLSAGQATALHEGTPDDTELWESKPTLQFLSIKPVNPPPDNRRPDRFRIIASDGTHFFQAMLATQLNDLVHNGVIIKNSICTIEKMICNNVGGKCLVIILGVRVEAREATKIGEPKGLTPPNNEAPGTSVPAPPVQPTPAVTSTSAQHQGQQRRPARHDNLYPIEALSPYQNNWTIKARVTQKSEVRYYSNARGEGKLFSVTFMDETGDIKGTAFNVAVDDLYDKLQEGKTYYISKARVDIAKKKFTNNQYELGLNVSTEIEEVTDSTQAPVIRYNFVRLQELNNIDKDAMCDVIAIIKAVGELGQIVTKQQKTLVKRELTLVDASEFSVRLTLWGKQAEQFQGSEDVVAAFKGVKVGDFGGRSLSMVSSSVMEINPDISEAHSLKGWYLDGGSGTSFQAFQREGGLSADVNRNEMRTINEAKNALADVTDKPEYFSTRATIMTVKNDNIAYPACRSPDCNKKVVEDHSSGSWRCERCEKNWDGPEYRYIISMAAADHTDQMWLQAFNDVAVTILNITADELMSMKEQDEAAYNNHMAKVNGKLFNFGVRAKQDTWNDTTRVRYGITKVQPVDFALETRSMLELLKSPWGQTQ